MRDERRKVYGEFVYKTVAAEEMLQSYCAQAGIDDLVDPISGVDVSKAVEECALMYATVSLLAGAKVRHVCNEVVFYLWECVTSSPRDLPDRPEQYSHELLITTMQHELGISAVEHRSR